MDNKYIYSDKLTNSANEALNKIIAEFREKVLEQAFLNSKQKDTAEKEISLSDILEAYSVLFDKMTNRQKADNRRKRMSFLIISSGIIYAFIGLIIYIFQNKEFNIENDLGIIIAILGVFMSLMGFFYQQTLNKRILLGSSDPLKSTSVDFETSEFELVKKWQAIEQLTSKLMKQKGYSENEAKSFNSLNNFLAIELYDKGKYASLKDLLTTRNRILHEGYKPDKNKMIDLIKKSNEIIDYLERKVENTMHSKK